MSNTLTVRLPEKLLDCLREKARRTGLPRSRVVPESLEVSLGGNQSWRKYVSIIKGGPGISPRVKDFHASEIQEVLHFCHMGNTLTVRLPEELLKRVREISRNTGLPVGRLVRDSLEKTLSEQ